MIAIMMMGGARHDAAVVLRLNGCMETESCRESRSDIVNHANESEELNW